MGSKMLWRNSLFSCLWWLFFFHLLFSAFGLVLWSWDGFGAHFCRFVIGFSIFRSPNLASQGRFWNQLRPNFATHRRPDKMAGGRRYSPEGESIRRPLALCKRVYGVSDPLARSPLWLKLSEVKNKCLNLLAFLTLAGFCQPL